jgi:uncharacterized protein with HEPN domain
MRPESRKLLVDMRDAAKKIAAFSRNTSQEDYLADDELRWAVERGFEIIGEAMAQLWKIDRPLATKISDHRKIISFRNLLIHGYSQINNKRTWAIVQHSLPTLQRELRELLGE